MSKINSIKTITAALDSLLDKLTDIVGLAEKNLDAAFRISDKIKLRWNDKKLNKLMVDLGGLGAPQEVIVFHLDKTVERLQKGDFEHALLMATEISDQVNHVAEVVSNIRDFLLEQHFADSNRDPVLFDGLVVAMLERQELLGELKDLQEVEIQQIDPQSLRELSNKYKELALKMQDYRRLLWKAIDGKK